MHIFIDVYIAIYVWLYIYIYICMYVCMYVCICLHIGIGIYLCMCMCVCIHIDMYTYTYVYVCVYIYIYVWITIPGLSWGILAITSEFWSYLLMFIWRKALVSPSGPQNAQFSVDNGLGHPKKIGNTFAVRLFVPPGSLLVNRVVQNSNTIWNRPK